jgi:uncharacterized repeat protein (TIGR03803 family)
VFELSPPAKPDRAWTEKVLHSFSGPPSDGFSPVASLIADGVGNLYGTTSGGGALNLGTAFRLKRPSTPDASWTETVLYSFTGGNDCAYPCADLIADSAGNLFGTTFQGGASRAGVVFEVAGTGYVPPARFAGTPGKANCQGQSVSALAQEYGGLAHAAAALGYSSVQALQNAIATYCAG